MKKFSKYISIIAFSCMFIYLPAMAQENIVPSKATQDKNARFQGLVSVGLHSTPSDPNVSPYASLSLGVNIKDRAYLGIGSGILTCFIPNMTTGYTLLLKQYGIDGVDNQKNWTLGSVMPLFYMQSDIFLTKSQSWRPYASVSVGTSFIKDMMTVGYSKLGFGVEYNGLAMQVGYTPMLVKYNSTLPQPRKWIFHGLYFEAGYRFESKRQNNNPTIENKSANSAFGDVELNEKTHFQGVGYIGVSAMPIPMPTASLSLGTIVKNRYFFGGGAGLMFYVNNYHDADPTDKSFYAYPLPNVFLQSDIYMKRGGRCDPYVTFAVGSVIPYAWYLKAGIGVDYRSFVWQLAYTPAFLFADSDYAMHGLTFNFGYRFNTVKYNRQHRATE